MANPVDNDALASWGDPVVDAAVSEAMVRAALHRLLESQVFRAAHGQRRFLKFTVEETLAGRGSQLKEFTVGVGAFERGGTFDPRLDPIVRTEARKLRARLAKFYAEEGAAEPIRIELPKGSYLPVFRTWANEVEAPSLPSPPVAEPEEPSPLQLPPARRWPMVALACSTVVLAAVVGYFVRPAPTSPAPPSPVAFESLAIMPIANLSGDRQQDSISEGLTSSLIDSLSREPGLRVVARTSVFRVSKADQSVSSLKAQLRVDAILKGTIERDGDSFRLRVRLEAAEASQPLWYGSFTFQPQFDASIEAEIAAEVVHVLRTGSSNPDRATVSAGAVSPAAYRHYLEGLRSWNELSAPSLQRAVEHFEQAIQTDASFARAHAALANTWIMLAHVSGTPAHEVASKAKASAARALQLDPALGDAHFSLAICAEYAFDWAGAERQFRRGLELSPSSALGHLWYSRFLAIMGRHREVLVHRTISADLDPLSPYAVQSVGGYWSVMGEYDQAIERFRRALELEPGFGLARQGLGLAQILNGQREEGLAELEAAAAIQGGVRTRSVLGYAYGLAGRQDKARRILADFLAQQQRGPFPALAIAHVYLGLGDLDHAFEWLEKAIDQRDLSATLQWDSLYAPLRQDARYGRLLRRMRLS